MIALVITLLAACECCEVDPEANRTINGYATFPKEVRMTGNADLGDTLRTALIASEGVATKSVAPPLVDQTLRLYGRKRLGDRQSGVIATAVNFVDGGIIFSVNPGGACNAIPIFHVTDDRVGFGSTVTSTCSSPSDPHMGSLVDQSSMSGHIALRSAEQYYLSIGGGLSERRDAVLPGGARPDCATDPRARLDENGNCYFPYGGMHGDTLTGSVYGPRYSGYLHEFYNPIGGGIRSDHRSFIDWNGAYAQNHQLWLSQFPRPDVDSFQTNLGTFYSGAIQSTIMYDFAPATGHHWYFSNGTAWVRFAEQPELEALKARVAALEAKLDGGYQ